MRIGTKSILFGAHAFWLHGWFVAAAWWRLYGFPKQLWLWVAFFVHDIGYWGKADMDGKEGESHPLVGAQLLYNAEFYLVKFLKWQGVNARVTGSWGNEVLLHSRFWARQRGTLPSDLCRADKYSITLVPWWLYVPMTSFTGEIHEYANQAKHHSDMSRTHPNTAWNSVTWSARKKWFLDLQAHMRNVVLQRRELLADVGS